MSDKLLPCPFCGAPAEKNGFGYYHLMTESFEIGCVNLSCRVRPVIRQDQAEYDEWNIDDEWNTRDEEKRG